MQSINPLYQFEVRFHNQEGLSLASIAKTPRLYSAHDLSISCENTNIICTIANPEPEIALVVAFILTEFFSLAHRTGLYNRQARLWEAIPKISHVSVNQLKKGIIKPKLTSLYDLLFYDHRNRILIAGHWSNPAFADKKGEDILKRFLNRTRKFPNLTGLFFASSKPYSQSMIDMVKKLTKGDDPIARYESMLPSPWKASLNLIEIEPYSKVKLIHPNITLMKRVRTNTAPK